MDNSNNTNSITNRKRKIDELEDNDVTDLAPKKQKTSHDENDDKIKLPNLSAASIRMQSLESEFNSGKDLFEKENKPRSVLSIKNRLQADFDMYKTIITVSPDGRIVGTQCDCSKESSYQWCEHVIATILFVSNRAASVVYYDTLKERINSLSIEELRNGLLNTVFAHPSALHVEVDCILSEPSFFASELSEDIGMGDRKKKVHSSAAVEDVINRIRSDLKNALRKYEQSRVFESSEDSYDDSPELGEGDFTFIKTAVEPYLIRIANLYHQGDTQTAIEIGIGLTDELMNTCINESEIHVVNVPSFVDLLIRVESTWTRLITYWTYQRDIAHSPEGQIGQETEVKLQTKLNQWRQMATEHLDDMQDYQLFKDCISANQAGWNDDMLKHILQGDIPLMIPRGPEAANNHNNNNNNNDDSMPSVEEVSEEEDAMMPVYAKKEASAVVDARIDALCLLGKAKEAVNLSTASGEHFKAAELLLAHGKIEQAVSEALKQNIEPADAIKFAKAIRDQDPTGAFCVAVIGLKTSLQHVPIALQVYLQYELPERWNATELGRWTLDFVLSFAKKKKSELGRQKTALSLTNEPMEIHETIVIDDEGSSKTSVAENTILPLADLASQSCVTILAEQEMSSVKRVLDSVPPEIQERLMLDILVELAGKEKYAEIRGFMLGQVDTLMRHKLLMPALRVLIAGARSQFANLRRAIEVASKLGSNYLIDTVTKCLKQSNIRRIESDEAFGLARHLLDKGFPREAISMGFMALSHTNNWQTATKKEIVGWIFKNAAAADCWNVIEEKLPSILGDLGNDAALLLELAKLCERDNKTQLAIRLGMGALRREPEDNGRHNIYDYDGGYSAAVTATTSNQTAIAWLLQLITSSKDKAKLLKELATKATEVLSSTTLFKLAKDFHDMKEDATAISLGMSAAAKAHSNSSTPRFEVFIWCVKLALSLPQSKEIDEAMEKGIPLVDNGKDALQLADIIYKGERDELALKFAMRALGTIRNSSTMHQHPHNPYWLMSKPITEDYYTPLSEEKVKLVDEALTFIAKIGKKLKCLDEVSRQHLKAINNSDVLWAFAKMLLDEKEEAMALEYGHQAVKEIHSTKSGMLLWVCKLAQSMGQLLATLNVIKSSLKNFDELYELSKYCHGLGHAEHALIFALDSLKYITSLSAEAREEVMDYAMSLVLEKRGTHDFELNVKKIAAQLKLAKDIIHLAKLCIKNKFPDLGLDVGLSIFRRDRTFDRTDLLWLCDQSWVIAKNDGITRVIEKCLANTSRVIDIISLAYFVFDVVKDKMRALELGEKALALVPQASQAQLNRSGHIHHVNDQLLHMRHRYLQRIVNDSYSSDDEDLIPVEEQMEFDEDINANVPRKITFGDTDDPKFLSNFCTWLCDLAHSFGQDRFRMTIDKCCEVLQRSQDNFEFARYVKNKGDTLKAARIMKDALNKTPPISMTDRRDYAKELYGIFWENADALQHEPLPEMESIVTYIGSCNELLDFADWIINLGTLNIEKPNNNNTNVEPAKKKRGPKPKKQAVEKMIVEEPVGGNPRMDTIKDALFIGRRSLDIPSNQELKRKASKWLLEKARLVKDAATEKKALAALFTTEPSLELLLEIKETMDPAFWPEERRNLLAKVADNHPVHIEIKFSDGQVEEALNSLSFGEQTLYNTQEANQRIPALLKATELFTKSKKLHKKEFVDKIVSLLSGYVWRSWIPVAVTSGYQIQSNEIGFDQQLEQALSMAKEVAPAQIKALLDVHKVLSKGRRLHVMPKKPSYQELARVLGEIRPVYKKHDRMPEFNRIFELIKQTQSNRPVCIDILKTFEIQAKAEDMQNQLNELKNIVE